MTLGKQENPEAESHRQFDIGYATGVLGLPRLYEILVDERKR